MSEKKADALKAQGNAKFQAGDLIQAHDKYSAAIALHEKAVYYSNRAASCLLLGRYTDAVADVKSALAVGGMSAKLLNKTLVRGVTAAHWADRESEKEMFLSELGALDEGLAAETRAQVTPSPGNTSNQQSSEAFGALPRLRASFNEEVEYYTIGHDDATNALEVSGAKLQMRTDEAGVDYARVLMCGFGDARHVFRTVSTAPKTAKLHFSLVDINVLVIARFAIIFDLLLSLREDDQGSLDVLARTYATSLLSPRDQERLMDVLAKFIEAKSCPHPVLGISDSQWTALKPTFRFWTRTDIISMQEMKKSFGAGGVNDPGFVHPQYEPRYSPEHKENMTTCIDMYGKKELAKEGASVDSKAVSPAVAHMKYIRDRVHGLNEFAFDRYQETFNLPGLMTSGINKAGALIDFADLGPGEDPAWLSDDRWRVNSTLTCPIIEESQKNPRINARVQNMMTSGASVLQALASKELCEKMTTPGRDSDAELASRLFIDNWRASAWQIFLPFAEALRRRVEDKTISFDVVVGDMHDHARALVAADASPFDLIFLSNIPDYTGVQSALVEFRKLLRRSPTSFIAHNNLVNHLTWHNEDHFLMSSTRVRAVADLERFLGYSVSRAHDSDMILWRLVEHTKLAPEGKLRLWLQELYFSIVAPPNIERPILPSERLPLNMAAFFETLSVLLERGYAQHLLASILEPLLEGSVEAKTSVALPTRSPYDFPRPGDNITDLSMFALEARAVGAIWAAQSEQCMRVYLQALGTTPYAPAIKATVKVASLNNSPPFDTVLPCYNALLHAGVVFLNKAGDAKEPAQTPSEDPEDDYPFPDFGGEPTMEKMNTEVEKMMKSMHEMMQGLMQRTGDPFGGKSAPAVMRRPGSALFSVTSWDIKSQTITFYVPANAVDRLRSTHEVVCLYRTDMHEVVGRPATVTEVIFHTSE